MQYIPSQKEVSEMKLNLENAEDIMTRIMEYLENKKLDTEGAELLEEIQDYFQS